MNKAELVEALEERLGSRKVATDAVEGVIDIIVRSVARGERVAISGFGTFERVARAARTGRNPRTGTPVKIKKTTVPKFKPGTAFKAFVAAPRSMPSVVATGGVAVTSRGLAVSAPSAARKTAAKKTTGAAGKTPGTAATKTTTAAAGRATAEAPTAESADDATATTKRTAATTKSSSARKTAKRPTKKG